MPIDLRVMVASCNTCPIIDAIAINDINNALTVLFH